MKSVRRLFAVLLLFLTLTLPLAGCRLSPLENFWESFLRETEQVEESEVSTTEQYQPDRQYHYYDKLTPQEQQAYGQIYLGVLRHSESVETPLLTEEQLTAVYQAISYDHPELICLNRSYRWINHDGYCTVKPDYQLNEQECQEKQRQMLAAAEEMVSALPAGLTDYEQEKALHDALVRRCYYDDNAALDYQNNPMGYSAYGALVEGKAVCEGYGRAMALLLNYVDIPNHLIAGYGKNAEGKEEAHLWNIVTIGGENYHLDPTYNDPFEEGSLAVSHLFFNLTDEEISLDHSGFSLEDSKAQSTSAGYFEREGLLFASYDREVRNRLVELLRQSLAERNPVVEFRFVEAEYYQEALSHLTQEGGIYELMQQAQENESNRFDDEQVYYAEFADRNILQLRPSYLSDDGQRQAA